MSKFRTALVAAAVSTISLGGLALPARAGGAPPVVTADSTTLIYEVKSGDHLYGIAAKLKVKLVDLMIVNKLAVTSVIHPGDKLIVPAGGVVPAPEAKPSAEAPEATPSATPSAAPPAAAPAPATSSVYVVVAGDYLSGIAYRNGVTLTALLTANKMTVTNSIFPGSKLTLPAATRPIPPAVVKPVIVPGPATQTPAATQTAPAAPQSTSIATVVAFLRAQLGKPYAFNTEGPDSYDCSGLVTAAYLQIGVSLPHQSLLQSTKGTAVDWRTQQIMPGDLVFQFSSGKPNMISHVGIAISDTQYIQAARTGDFVKISPMPSGDRIQAVRRIVQP